MPLTNEERSARARKAAQVMWKKKRAAKEPAPEPVPPPPPARRKQSPVPREFRGALSYAQKRIEAAMKERTAAIMKTGALNAEIEYLAQNIRSLGGTVPLGVAPIIGLPQQHPMAAYMPNAQPQTQMQQPQMPTLPVVPELPSGHGGGVELDFVPTAVEEPIFR